MATTSARSIGGKSGLATSAFAVLDGELAGRPALSPTSHVSFAKSDAIAGLGIAEGGLFVDQQHESKALYLLNENRSPSHGDACLLQKYVGESTGEWS